MSVKKLLVAYDETKPYAGKGDFLAVVFEGTKPFFFGLRSRRAHEAGRLVFVGRDITEKDVFSKLIDSGRKIESVEQTLETLGNYLQQLATFKIGNVLTISSSDSKFGFELIKVAEVPKSEVSKLP